MLEKEPGWSHRKDENNEYCVPPEDPGEYVFKDLNITDVSIIMYVDLYRFLCLNCKYDLLRKVGTCSGFALHSHLC